MIVPMSMALIFARSSMLICPLPVESTTIPTTRASVSTRLMTRLLRKREEITMIREPRMAAATMGIRGTTSSSGR